MSAGGDHALQYAASQGLTAAPHTYVRVSHQPRQGTRDSLGIKLEGNIVLIDEGHNLLDTLSALHTVELSEHQVSLNA